MENSAKKAKLTAVEELNLYHEERELAPLIEVSAKKDSNLENEADFQSGKLKHKPPTFEYFEPIANESKPVHIKEIKLPNAKQTHEVCYEPKTQCVFVSQMSSCVLVRIPIDENGFLMNEQDAWKIGQRNEAGEGIEGIAIFNFVRATNSIQRMKP